MLEPSPVQALTVRLILDKHLPGRQVQVFGSRARGRAVKRWSDLDLVVLGDAPVSLEQRAALAASFDDSDLPFRIDLMAWCEAPPALRAAVAADRDVQNQKESV